jgi:hypothetical protein
VGVEGEARGGIMRDRFYSRFLNGRDPIRALYVVPTAGFGGVERQLSFVLPQLPAWGVKVVPLVGPASTLVSWLEAEGTREVVHSQAFEVPAEPSWGVLGRLLSLGCAWRGARRIGDEVERLIHERMIDVVVGAGPLGWMAATEPARRLGLPVVWWAADEPGPGDKVIGRGLSAFGRPDLFLAASDQIAQGWSAVVHAPTEVVTGAIDLNRFRRGSGPHDRLRPEGAHEVVGHAGRLLDQTAPGGIDGFLEMAARLRATRPGVRFLVAGDGSGRARAERAARDRGLAGALDFLGYVSDMRGFYGACDLMVTRPPSGRMAQVALEAMAMQVPVVEGPDDRAVSALLDDASLGAALAARNLERARQLDAHRTARRTARLLHTLVAWSGAGAAPPVLAEPSRPRLVLAT